VLQMSRSAPYAVLMVNDGSDQPMFKIHKEFEVNPEWLTIALENVLYVKIDNERDDVKPLYFKWKRYASGAFTVDSGGKLIATFDISLGARYVSREEFVERVMSMFPLTTQPRVIRETDNSVVIYFVIPSQCVDSAIFYELTMNSSIFNSVVAIDESIRASKISQSIYLHRLNSTDTINIHQKTTSKHNEFGMVNVGEPYVQCRMRSTSIATSQQFQQILGKLFTEYNNEYARVVDDYKRYIKNFTATTCAKTKRLAPSGLRAIAPEVFAPNFSRRCSNPPEIVRDDTVTGPKTMQFPLHGEVVNGIPVTKRTYSCTTDDHPYIGLRANDLENREIFPLIPCCFSSNQSNKKGSLFRKYVHGEQETIRQRQIQETAANQRRLLLPRDMEELPERLRKLFHIVDSDPHVSYKRVGVSRSKHSSVEAILLGKGQINYKTQRVSTITNIIQRNVLKLHNDIYAMAAKQELYDLSVERILYMIKTSDLRPSKFVHALETAFDCNIFVFSADNGGTFVVPRHTRGYYKFKPNRETFLLFQHYGDTDRLSTTPALTYPHVELITRNQGGSFLPGDIVIRRLFSIFNKMTKTYINGDAVDAKTRIKRIPVVGQSVDTFGKCRIINLEHDQHMLTLILDEPMAPFAALPLTDMYRSSLDVIKSFVIKWGAQLVWQRVTTENFVSDVCIDIGLRAVVLCDSKSTPIENVVKRLDDVHQSDITISSTIRKFSRSTKTAIIILEYALWLMINGLPSLPQHIDKSNIDGVLLDFVANRTTIIPNHKYDPYESVKFIFPSSFVTADKRLILSNQDMLRRLMFVCRLRILAEGRVPNYIGNHIPKFYSSVSDFTDEIDSFIVEGVQSVRNLIETYGVDSIVTNSVRRDATKPYFFKNNRIRLLTIFIAQPVDSLDAAIATVSTWIQTGINDVSDGDTDNDTVPIYSYVNELDIRLLHSGHSTTKGVVIGYKLNNIAKYVALLQL
jgi:hypothetical protein